MAEQTPLTQLTVGERLGVEQQMREELIGEIDGSRFGADDQKVKTGMIFKDNDCPPEHLIFWVVNDVAEFENWINADRPFYQNQYIPGCVIIEHNELPQEIKNILA